MNRADYATPNTPHSGGELFDVIAEWATSRHPAGSGVSAPFPVNAVRWVLTLLNKEHPMGLRASDVVLVDPRKLDDHHALEAEHASLVLLHGALEGLEDVAAGRVLDEAELDPALSATPKSTLAPAPTT